MPPSSSETWSLIRYVVEQTVSLEADLAGCLHDLARQLASEGRGGAAADCRAASIRHRVRAIELQALGAAAGLTMGPASMPACKDGARR